MKYGWIAPNFGYLGEAAALAELAAEAEAAGWDGFFLWDHVQWPGMEPAVDPWVALAAMATATERLALGTLVTPIARRDIAKLARETVSVDRLSRGRLILGVGLGTAELPEWGAFGHETDARKRGEMLDEGLGVLAELWSGEPVSHRGEHFRIETEGFAPPLQEPHIPVWIAGQWPGTRPFRRAARWQGCFPISADAMEGGTLSPDDCREIRGFLAAHKKSDDELDLAQYGETRDASDASRPAEFAAAGVTWWMEGRLPWTVTRDELRQRVRGGPPKGA